MRSDDGGFDTHWLILFGAWLAAVVASGGSSITSLKNRLPPCSLCWYQRCFMFPLVVVLTTGLVRFEPGVVRYALPLAVAGWLVAAYHVLVYAGIVPESATPCSQGVSCAERTLELLGFLSIPLLSLLAFSAIGGALLVLRRRLAS